MRTKAGVGFSDHRDAHTAGFEAASQALQKLGALTPNLVVAFTTDCYDQERAVAGVRSAIGEAPLLGCCAAGVLTATALSTTALAVMALHAEDLDVRLVLEDGVRANPAQLSEAISDVFGPYIDEVDPSNTNMLTLVLADGVTGALPQMVTCLTDELGPLCPLVGGGAGDNLKFLKTVQFINGDIRSDALAAALLRTPQPLGIGVGHGWKPVGNALVVTRAEAEIVYEIDGRPAFEVYKEVWAEEAPNLDTESFSGFAAEHPLGMPLHDGEYLIRDPLRVQDDGSIVFVAAVPENAVVRMMHGNFEDLFAAARDAAQQALDALDGQPPAAVIVFNCVSRLFVLGDAAQTEIDHIREVVGHDTPIIGMFSFGEISPPPGASLAVLHNKTVVLSVLT